MILCCGEALIDFVPLPDVRAYSPCPGGSVYNVAVALGRLNRPVSFFCKISTDYFGDLLVNYLVENRVNVNLCIRDDDPTTLAFVSLPNETETEPQFMFYANDSADRLLAVEELPELADDIRVLHFGSISLVMEPGATTLEAFLMRESGKRIISLDPNIRSSLIADRENYSQRFERWLSKVDILKLSKVDFDFIYPSQQVASKVQRWFDLGVNLCVISDGANKVEGFTAAGAYASAIPPKVKLVDTVGAGDTFWAAMLANLDKSGHFYDKDKLRNMQPGNLQECLDYACRAAAINCSRQGANPPFDNEMESLDA